jgi:hypothetical protein
VGQQRGLPCRARGLVLLAMGSNTGVAPWQSSCSLNCIYGKGLIRPSASHHYLQGLSVCSNAVHCLFNVEGQRRVFGTCTGSLFTFSRAPQSVVRLIGTSCHVRFPGVQCRASCLKRAAAPWVWESCGCSENGSGLCHIGVLQRTGIAVWMLFLHQQVLISCVCGLWRHFYCSTQLCPVYT